MHVLMSRSKQLRTNRELSVRMLAHSLMVVLKEKMRQGQLLVQGEVLEDD